MGDCCCPIEFTFEHYLTFSRSLLCIILCLLSQKAQERRVFDRGNRELENAKVANMNLILHLKWLFRTLSNCFFATSRAERYSAYKMKVLHVNIRELRISQRVR